MIISQLLAIATAVKGVSQRIVAGYALLIIRRWTFSSPQILASTPYVRETTDSRNPTDFLYSLSRQNDTNEALNRRLSLSAASRDQWQMMCYKLLSLNQIVL